MNYAVQLLSRSVAMAYIIAALIGSLGVKLFPWPEMAGAQSGSVLSNAKRIILSIVGDGFY